MLALSAPDSESAPSENIGDFRQAGGLRLDAISGFSDARCFSPSVSGSAVLSVVSVNETTNVVRSALFVTLVKATPENAPSAASKSLATDWLSPFPSFAPLTLKALPAGKRRCKAELGEVGAICCLAEDGKAVTPLASGKTACGTRLKRSLKRIRVTAQPRSKRNW